MKTKNIITWILILIIIDQAIKILIYTLFGEINFEIIPSLVEFKPKFNVNHSWVNVLLNKNFGINVGLLPHIIMYIMIGILIPVYFSYFRNNIPTNKKLIDTATIFLMAAILCALIGNTIWQKGTLDFIYFKPFSTVSDLKDTYSDIGIIIFLIYVFKNRVQLNRLKIRDVYLDTKSRLKDKK
jgi:hypothetical protein